MKTKNTNAKPLKSPDEGKHHKRGPESGYEPLFARIAAGLCLDNATDKAVARILGVNKGTIVTWRKQNPEFHAAFQRSRKGADAQVEMSLFQQAVGGSVVACIFWLKNRQPDKWRDVNRAELAGFDGKALGPLVQIITSKAEEK